MDILKVLGDEGLDRVGIKFLVGVFKGIIILNGKVKKFIIV